MLKFPVAEMTVEDRPVSVGCPQWRWEWQIILQNCMCFTVYHWLDTVKCWCTLH